MAPSRKCSAMLIFDTPIPLIDELATAHLAQSLAPILQPGDTLLLDGQIGAGKSAFCRALIRARFGAEIDVPSPTFTLVQTYDDEQAEIWHCDLYRLGSVDEVIELGLEDAFATGICLIEWPDRLGDLAPKNALSLSFAALENSHQVVIRDPAQAWRKRLKGLF